MKKRTFLSKVVAASAFLILSGTTSAACFTYYCEDTISMLIADTTGVSVKLTNGLSGLTNCTPQDGLYLRVPKTDPNYSSYYALLLAAKTADRSIGFRPTDSSSNCSVSYAYLL